MPILNHRQLVDPTRWVVLVLGVLWTMGTASVAAAQQPTSQVLAFMGTMPGQPDGSVALRLRLFPVSDGGAPVFEETQTVTVMSERFTVRIGDATAGGVPATVFHDNPSLWIAFAMDSMPDLEIGFRTAITSGGYAHAAQLLTTPTVRTLNGLSSDVAVAAGTNITITPNGNTLTIDAAGSGLPSVSHDATLTGNGTSGSPLGVAANGITNAQIANGALSPAKITGGGAIVGPNVFTGTQVINSGNLGLGIATPNFPLSFRAIVGDKISLYGDAGNHYGFGVQPNLLQIHTDSPLSDIAFGSGTSAAFTGTMRLKGNGDVYVGNVTNPALGGKSIFFENQEGNAQNSFRINAGAAGYPYDSLFLVGYSNTGSTRGTGIKFFTAPAGGGQAERMSIDPNGNVGIGTSVPAAKLDAETFGGVAVFGASGGGSGTGVYGRSDNGVGVIGESQSGWGGFFFGKVVVTVLGTGGGTPLCLNGSSEIAACSSSLRYKTDVRPFMGGLDLVQRLRPIAFTWKQSGAYDVGLAAEEVEQVEPLLTFHNDKGEIEGVKYNQLSAVFVNAIRDQQSQIEQQKGQIEQQEEQIARQQEQLTQQQGELAALKALVCPSHAEADVCR